MDRGVWSAFAGCPYCLITFCFVIKHGPHRIPWNRQGTKACTDPRRRITAIHYLILPVRPFRPAETYAEGCLTSWRSYARYRGQRDGDHVPYPFQTVYYFRPAVSGFGPQHQNGKWMTAEIRCPSSSLCIVDRRIRKITP
ncbi:hypothetical protein BDV59DRAFT_186548 [Aspergillus ambiguus]|uniref:uncharacterized protein n=1 Tax=Aspergillus ambiguus TaxID=176160 RepID=UPI003CCE362A